MDFKYVLVIIIIIVVILFLYNKQENVDTVGVPLSNEAIQAIASVYNTQNFKATNIEATGLIKGKLTGDVSGNLTGNLTGNAIGNLTGNVKGELHSPNGKYKLSIDDDGNLHVKNQDNNDVNIKGNFAGDFMGNLYNSGRKAFLTVQDDLNLVMYCKQNGSALWSRVNGNQGSC